MLGRRLRLIQTADGQCRSKPEGGGHACKEDVLKIWGEHFGPPVLGLHLVALLDVGDDLPSDHIADLWLNPDPKRPEAKHRAQKQAEQDAGGRGFVIFQEGTHDERRCGNPDSEAHPKRHQGLQRNHHCFDAPQFDAIFEPINCGAEDHHVLPQKQQNKASRKTRQDHGSRRRERQPTWP